ncbi:MAG: zinc ribbon domain-containing protein [Phycisphaerae bacterium]
MPIYEYVCEKCGKKFELLKSKMVKNSREKCPACGAIAKQQLSCFGVGSSSANLSAGESMCADAGCQPGHCPSGGCPYSGM